MAMRAKGKFKACPYKKPNSLAPVCKSYSVFDIVVLMLYKEKNYYPDSDKRQFILSQKSFLKNFHFLKNAVARGHCVTRVFPFLHIK